MRTRTEFKIGCLFAGVSYPGILVKPQNEEQRNSRKIISGRQKVQKRQLRKIEKLIQDGWKISSLIVNVNRDAVISLEKK